MKHIFLAFSLLAGLGSAAQDLNTEITVSHEVVPEEQAATRMRQSPGITLPKVSAGRLSMISRFMPAEMTPYINPLSAAQYADTARLSPWCGYAVLGYGPAYNLAASAGYRFVERNDLTVDGFMQFDGMSYTSKYPGIPYDGKVCFRRNTALAGARTAWSAGCGTLDASVLYQYSGFNFPILDLLTLRTDKHRIDANVAKVKVGWGSHVGEIDYYVRHDYDMIYFGKGGANNNRFDLTAGVNWRASDVSAWMLDAGFSLDHSSLIGNKGIVHLVPKYCFESKNVTFRLGLDVDITTGNCRSTPMMLVAPDVDITWRPWTFISLWGKINGRIDDNSRARLFDEQPYLLADFDAGFSRMYNGEVGLRFGPFRGASINIFGGYTQTSDWYIPALLTGYMSCADVKGWHGGAALAYDYRRYLSLNVRAEVAESPDGNYARGYAPWRDHARFNLTAQATVRPIAQLDLTAGYHLRTGRQKQLPAQRNMNLRTISNLQVGAAYRITPQWSAFVRGENLLNKHWYLGPAVPSQGIMVMVGATYKF